MSGNLAGIIALVMWSFANLLVTSTGDVPPFLLGCLVMVPGGLLLLGHGLLSGKKIGEICHQSSVTYLITLSGIGGYILLNFVAFKIASPFEVNVIDYTWPLFLVLFVSLIHGEKLGIFRISGILMGAAGMVLLFSDRLEGFQTQDWLGYVLSLIAAILFGLYGTLTRNHHFPNSFIGVVFIIVGSVSLVLHILFEHTIWPDHISIWFAIAGLVVIRSAYSFWDHAMTKGDAVMLASLSYFLPLSTTLLFILFGRMPLSPWTGLAGMLIVAGCLVANFREMKKVYYRVKS